MEKGKDKVKRHSKTLPDTAQQTLFKDEIQTEPSAVLESRRVEFENPSPHRIFVGDQSLQKFLKSSGLDWVVKMRAIIESSDLALFERSYRPTGRKPFHPVMMLGLIVYGILQKQWSLRELEMLSKRDVGAWWMCGGRHPDHSTIGRFIRMHADVLTEEYFVSLTSMLVKKLRIQLDTVAGDGTVIQSAADGYKTIKEEAAKQAAKEAREKLRQSPEDIAAKREAEKAEAISDAVARRTKLRKEERKKVDGGIKISPSDPEAVIQKTKGGGFKLAYVPSLLVNKDRFIVGQYTDPSDETASVVPMLEQCRAIDGKLPRLGLFDANYSNNTVLSLAIEFEMDILCPSGQAARGEWEKSKDKGKRFGKGRFIYDEASNTYICPDGRPLICKGKEGKYKEQWKYKYQCASCKNCQLRNQCTDSKRGRVIYRYEVDELKEAMNEVFKNGKARQEYMKRQVMVEPVYGELKERQGLTRFHRRGLKFVKAEFAIHCIAHNLKKALCGASAGAFFVFLWRDNTKIRLFSLYVGPNGKN